MIRGKYLTSQADISQVLAVRRAVFVDEQGYSPSGERDAHDGMAVYALAFSPGGDPVATGRLYLDDFGRFAIGRVCVLAPFRGQGYGDLVMRMLLYRAQELGAPAVTLSAQIPAIPFYARYGFAETGEESLDEGVPHKRLAVRAEDINLEGSCKGCAHSSSNSPSSAHSS